MREEQLHEAMELHTEHLLRLAYFYVQSWEAAEDIVQESFIAFYEKAAQYKGEASVKNYVRKIVINRCHDYLRRKKRWQLFLPFNALAKRSLLPQKPRRVLAQVLSGDEFWLAIAKV